MTMCMLMAICMLRYLSLPAPEVRREGSSEAATAASRFFSAASASACFRSRSLSSSRFICALWSHAGNLQSSAVSARVRVNPLLRVVRNVFCGLNGTGSSLAFAIDCESECDRAVRGLLARLAGVRGGKTRLALERGVGCRDSADEACDSSLHALSRFPSCGCSSCSEAAAGGPRAERLPAADAGGFQLIVLRAEACTRAVAGRTSSCTRCACSPRLRIMLGSKLCLVQKAPLLPNERVSFTGRRIIRHARYSGARVATGLQ
jgi:hypothetical protein